MWQKVEDVKMRTRSDFENENKVQFARIWDKNVLRYLLERLF